MKKFISIALIMLAVTAGFLIASKSYIGNKIYASDGLFEDIDSRQEIKFLKYEKTDVEHQIYVTITNKWKRIVDINGVQLTFKSKDDGSVYDNFHIDGYEYNDYSEGYTEPKMGIEPGESKVYIFKIPKAVSFDKEVFDFDTMSVSGQISEYLFRIRDNSLYGGFASWTCRGLVENTGEPIIIDNN